MSPAAEKVSLFRGSAAIGGPNRAGNCNAATVSACSPSKPSAQLRARRDGIIHHDEVQALLTVLGVDGGDQHAVALQAHHLPGRHMEHMRESLQGLFESVGSGTDMDPRNSFMSRKNSMINRDGSFRRQLPVVTLWILSRK